MPPSIPEALAVLRAALAAQMPGFLPTQITITGVAGSAVQKVKLPFLDAPAAPAAAPTVTAVVEEQFLPNEVQTAILESLEGKFMRTDSLAAAVSTALGIEGARGRLFKKPGGIQELIDEGLVRHHNRRGYYSTSAPPAELAPSE